MTCISCERKSQANFYNRFVSKVGHSPISMLMATAYFAGLRLSDTDVRSDWDEKKLVLRLLSLTRGITVSVCKGSQNVTLLFAGTAHQITMPEDAGFIVQGKKPPT